MLTADSKPGWKVVSADPADMHDVEGICMAETEAGRVISLRMAKQGGEFEAMFLKVTDQDGKLLHMDIYETVDPFKVLSRESGDGTLVVFNSEKENGKIALLFGGKAHAMATDAEMLAVLKDSERKRQPDNSLSVTYWENGRKVELSFADVVWFQRPRN